MSKLFLENNESKHHNKMKEKLFNLIVEGNLKIKDQNNTEYSIYNKEHKNEFLHVESFVFKPEQEKSYINNVFFSSDNLPCVSYLGFNSDTIRPMCDLKGACGAFEKLPCNRCLDINLTEDQKQKIRIGFTPDIAFGYEGKHVVWLEILCTSSCSEHKISFCRENDILLLEIDANDIKAFKNGDLVFNNLTDKVATKIKEQVFFDSMIDEIYSSGHVLKRDFCNNYWINFPNSHSGEYLSKYCDFIKKYDLSEVEQHTYDEHMKKELNIRATAYPVLIANEEFMDALKELRNIKIKNAENVIPKIINDLIDQVDNDNFTPMTDVRNKLFKEFKKTGMTKNESELRWKNILIQHNLVQYAHPKSRITIKKLTDSRLNSNFFI